MTRRRVVDLQVWAVGSHEDVVALRAHLASLGRIAVPRDDDGKPHFAAGPQSVGNGLYRVFVRLYIPKQ